MAADPVLVQVGSDLEDPKLNTHDISLQDENRTIGLRLRGAAAGMDIGHILANNVIVSGGGSRYGEGGPNQSEAAQSDWTFGRGVEALSTNASGFYDSKHASSMVDGRFGPGMANRIATGLRDEDRYIPDPLNLDFVRLTQPAEQTYVSIQFTASASYNAKRLYCYLRRRGDPGGTGVTAALYSDDGGDKPDTALQTKTLTTVDIDDELLLWQPFKIDTEALTSGTKYHFVVYGAAEDTQNDYWEIGIDQSETGSFISPDGSTWTTPANTFKLIFRVVGPNRDRNFQMLTMNKQFYLIERFRKTRKHGATSKCYMLGDRGKASSGTTTSLTDSDKGMRGAWATDQWKGWTIYIVNNVGEGQVAEITGNDTSGKISWANKNEWGTAPNNTSHYILVNGYDFFEIPEWAPGGDCEHAAEHNDVMWCARGSGEAPRQFHCNHGLSPPKHEMRTDGGGGPYPDRWGYFDDPVAGPQAYSSEHHSDETYGQYSDWPAYGSDLEWSSQRRLGNKRDRVTRIIEHDGKLYIFKPNNIFYRTLGTDKIEPLNVKALRGLADNRNGVAAISFNNFLWFSYGGFTVVRLLGNEAIDVGPWQGEGLPDERRGWVNSMTAMHDKLIIAINAGRKRKSSVMMYEGGGYHPVFECDENGQEIRNIGVLPVISSGPQLFISCGTDVYVQQYPDDSFNPRQDPNVDVIPEAVLISSTIDYGTYRMPKLSIGQDVVSEGLGPELPGKEIRVMYQWDNDIGTKNWTRTLPDSTIHSSPFSTVFTRRGNVRRVRMRYQLISNGANDQVWIKGLVHKSFVRTPNALSIPIQIYLGGKTHTGKEDHTGAELWQALLAMSQGTESILLRSRNPLFDNRYVIVQPPSLRTTLINFFTKNIQGYVSLTLQEQTFEYAEN